MNHPSAAGLCRSIALFLLVVLTALAGCSPLSSPDWAKRLSKATEKPDSKAPGPQKLKIGGQNLGEGQEVSLTPQELIRNVDELLDADRAVTAGRNVFRHPEAAQEALRQAGALQAKPQVWAVIARAHDAQVMRNPQKTSWEKLVAQRKANPESFTKFDQARTQFMTRTSHGEAEDALRLDLPGLADKTGETLLKIDAWQLQGTAHLLAEKPQEAIAAWKKALTLAQETSDYQVAYLLLLLSNAQRRTGDAHGATATWVNAVATVASLMRKENTVCDPVLLERLAYLRPVQNEWPEPFIRRLLDLEPIAGAELVAYPALAEAALWNVIGKWYLDRGHHQSALVSFKRAESVLTDVRSQHYMRFRQARALILLNQNGAAAAVLVALANDRTSHMARPAMGLLGSLRMQSGNPQQGFNLLRKAVEREDMIDWPERADAEADLGLAFLMFNDEKQGLRWLHQAQNRFESRREFESLTLALLNEANYLSHAKKHAEATAIRDRLMSMERN